MGLLGQLPGIPLEPLGTIEGWLLAYVSRVASGLGSPGWAQVEVALPSPGRGRSRSICCCPIAAALAIATLRRRRGLRHSRALRIAPALCVLAALVGIALPGTAEDGPPPDTLEIVELDVGQGDATLIRPPGGAPVLVDAGPPGGAAAESLDRAGHRPPASRRPDPRRARPRGRARRRARGGSRRRARPRAPLARGSRPPRGPRVAGRRRGGGQLAELRPAPDRRPLAAAGSHREPDRRGERRLARPRRALRRLTTR